MVVGGSSPGWGDAPEPESSAPEPESSAPEPDSSGHEPESSAPEPDSSGHEPESSAPEPDLEPAESVVVGRGPTSRLDLAILLGLVVLAAILRFVNLAARGQWDADQGHDLLVLDDLVHRGIVPLLGPPTSIGDIHHGALYYYLLSPAAFVSGADPVAVVGWIALAGVAAVAVTWWLARDIGGPLAGLIAGLLMAVAASAIEESTFVWNPNLIALAAAVALAAAWRAWTTGRARWWLVSAAGTATVMQLHVLGIVLLPAMATLFGLVWWRATPQERSRTRFGRVAVGCVAIIAVAYVPLLVHELGHDFEETRNALAWLAGGREGGGTALAARLGLVGLRVVSWPLTGLVTDAPGLAVVAAIGLTGLAIVAWRAQPGWVARAVAWLGLTVAWSIVGLALLASDLDRVVPGLPNDHYHAFADPAIFVLAGIVLAWVAEAGRRGWAAPAGAAAPAMAMGGRAGGTGPRSTAGLPAGLAAAASAVVVLGLMTWNLWSAPPLESPDGGWPAALAAGERIAGVVGGAPVALVGLPGFKPTDAYGFPLRRLGVEATEVEVGDGRPAPGADVGSIVILCDRLFEAEYDGPCGGAAEASIEGDLGLGAPVDRFDASARTVVSVYRRSG